MKLSPEEAEAIYHDARLKAMLEASNYTRSVVQRECDLKGWSAVIGAIRIEAEKRLALEMLEKGGL